MIDIRRGIVALLALLALLGVAAADAPPRIASVEVPAGLFIAGSTPRERETAYRLDEKAYGHDVTRRRQWYANEPLPMQRFLPAYRIMATPVTNRLYARFVAATGHRAPFISEPAWKAQRLAHPYARVRGYLWRDGKPPPGKEDHPVVLVSHADAVAFARWLSRATGHRWRLPTEDEWEKAMRGAGGRMFPWGDVFDPRKLNSADAGPFATVPVGRFPAGASPYGVLDGAGQVYEWTATPAAPGRHVVKGGSWDDKGCGVCRPAARHGRPDGVRHILIGFRLVRE